MFLDAVWDDVSGAQLGMEPFLLIGAHNENYDVAGRLVCLGMLQYIRIFMCVRVEGPAGSLLIHPFWLTSCSVGLASSVLLFSSL